MNDGELELIQQSVKRFAEREVAPMCDALNHYPDVALPARLRPGLEELGLLDLEHDPTVLCAVVEGLSRVCAATAAMVLTNALTRAVLAELGRVNGSGPKPGSLGAYPIYDEPGDAGQALVLREQDERFVLSGTRSMVALAPVADYLVLPAADAAGASPALVLVDANTPGVQVGEPLLTLGMRGCPTADVHCDLVRIAPERVLARGARAASVLESVAARFLAPVAALVTGSVEASFATAAQYAQDRYQGGRYIIDHEQVRALLADMLADLASCRGAVGALRHAPAPSASAAALFVRVKDIATRATTDGVQLLGGNGYMEDYGQERCMRDARQAACLLGRPDYWRQRAIHSWLEAGAGTAHAMKEAP